MQPPERHEVDWDRKQDMDKDQAQMPAAARFAPEEEAVSFIRAVCPAHLAIP